jgi:hypothetical protein
VFLAYLASKVAMLGGVLLWALWPGPPAPADQPVQFNHKLHIEQKMECTDCHTLATQTRRSGLPTANLCTTCHRAIKKDSPEIQKIARYRATHQSIPWVRLYQLPDFVYYNHMRHVKAGIECSVCHGNTGREPEARAYRDFSMRFCMDCHEQRKVSNDCATCHT